MDPSMISFRFILMDLDASQDILMSQLPSSTKLFVYVDTKIIYLENQSNTINMASNLSTFGNQKMKFVEATLVREIIRGRCACVPAIFAQSLKSF